MDKIRQITLFSGYDSQALAMERLKRDSPAQFDYELVAWCEIDEMAIHAHNALFPKWTDRNVGDICKVSPEELPDCDVITWSFPCQDISTAGKQNGLAKDSGTASSLAWECMKIFRAKRPKFLLMENVKALTQQKFMPDFMRLQKELEDMGYTNFLQVLNAKDYGVPQNRERVFMVSILNAEHGFEFPKPFSLEKRLRDVLEEKVEESYYLKDEQVHRILAHCERKKQEGCGFKENFTTPYKICGTITGNYGQRETDTYLKLYETPTGGLSEPKIIGYTRDHKGNVQSYHEKDCANTIHTHIGSGGNTDQFVREMVIGSMQANAMRGSLDGVSPCLTEAMGTGGGQIPMVVQNAHGYNKGGLFEDISPTVTSSAFQDNNYVAIKYRIRKLTPTEFFRLMGVDDADIDKIDAYRIKKTLKDGTVKEKPIPKSQKYKMAGNSIVVDVLYHIFYQMFIAEPPKPQPKQLSLFDLL